MGKLVTGTTFILLAGLGVMGCKGSRDHSKVVASVAGEKITEKAFSEALLIRAGDEARAKEVLTKEENRPMRNQVLESMALEKALGHYAKAEHLDADPKVRQRIEEAVMRIYIETILERRSAKADPTEAQLKALYEELVGESRKAGQTEGLPTYEQAKAQLPQLWQQRRSRTVGEEFKKELQQKYPVTYAEGYKPPVAPVMP